MQNFDPVLETRVLKTILDQQSGELYGRLSPDFFGTPVIREVWERITILKNHGKSFPSSQTMSLDPVLSPEARTLMGGPVGPFRSGEIDIAFEQLDSYRKTRMVYWMLSKTTEQMKTTTPDFVEVQKLMETCLRGMNSASIEDELLSYGGRNDVVLDMYDRLLSPDAESQYIPTGFNVIDKQQGGLGRGRLYAIGANSGGGKSTLSNQLAIHAYRNNFSACYASFEMSREECLLRTQSYISRVPNDRFQLKTLSEEQREVSDRMLAEFLVQGETQGCRLDYIVPKRDLNLNQFFSSIESLNYDLVVIDYINLMAPINPKEAAWWNIGEGFRIAKRFAERNKCVVLMLVQIDEETKAIKYAKSIKHHSDGVWIWTTDENTKKLGVVEVEQIKLRNFAPTKFTLKPEFEYSCFTESYGPGALSAQTDAPKNPNQPIAPMRL